MRFWLHTESFHTARLQIHEPAEGPFAMCSSPIKIAYYRWVERTLGWVGARELSWMVWHGVGAKSDGVVGWHDRFLQAMSCLHSATQGVAHRPHNGAGAVTGSSAAVTLRRTLR